MQFHLESKRRRAVMIPVVNNAFPEKKAKQNYVSFYKAISDMVYQGKFSFVVEILFIMPRDQFALDAIEPKYKKEEGLHDKLVLLCLKEQQYRTPNAFLAFLPKVVCIQVNNDERNRFNADSSFSQAFRQLSEYKQYDEFEIHQNIRDLVSQMEKKPDSSIITTRGEVVESTFTVILFSEMSQLQEGIRQCAKKLDKQ